MQRIRFRKYLLLSGVHPVSGIWYLVSRIPYLVSRIHIKKHYLVSGTVGGQSSVVGGLSYPLSSHTNSPHLDLSIIIVNFNVKYFLEQCLYSVMKACRNIDAEIFVVDNASTDSSREYLESKFPNVQFKWNTENVGFAKANNSVLPETKGRFVLFLNPDTIIAEDCLELCLSFAAGQNNFGGLGIRMIDGSGEFLKESKRSFPSASATFFKMSGIHSLYPRSRLFSSYYAGHLPPNENHEIDVLAGAFMIINKKALDETGGFDEDFFMYGEDIDLSFRIREAGYKNFYFAGSTIIHFKGESTRLSPLYISHFYGAMELFVKKHATGKMNDTFIRFGIAAARKFTSVKLFYKNRIQNGPAGNDAVCTNTTAILAGQQRFNEVLQLAKFSKTPLVIKGRIAIDPNDADYSIGKLKDMEHLIKKKMFNHLIFSEGDASFKEIISWAQKFKSKLLFLFHAQGSNSIVGSNKRNEKGIFISRK